MLHLPREETKEIYQSCAEHVEAAAEMLSDLDGRLTGLVQTVDWSCFTPSQRATLAQWHIGSREALLKLRSNHA